MVLTCQLAGVAYLSLYEEIAANPELRAAVAGRLEELGPTTLDELVDAYRLYWRVFSDRTSMLFNEGHVLDPLPTRHGELASWLIAPLRTSGDSTELGHSARSRALGSVTAAGVAVDDMSVLNIAVVGWSVGQVWGDLDRSMPVVPAVPFDDEDLRVAYEGLVQHTGALAGTSWAEMAGSAVFMRVAGLTEALRPQPKASLGSSISQLVGDCKPRLPTSVTNMFAGNEISRFVRIRNAFTHVKQEEGDPDGLGFANVHELAIDHAMVKGLLRAASCFVCSEMSYRALADERIGYWEQVLDDILDEFRGFADYVDV